jgi:uracil-DNA glycosylase
MSECFRLYCFKNKAFEISTMDENNLGKDNMTDKQAITALLEWYVASGVDLAVDEVPQNRFEPTPSAPAPMPQIERQAIKLVQPASPANIAPVNAPFLTPDAAIKDARQRASQASNLAELKQALLGYEGCGLKRTATQLVFEAGVAGSRVMVIGDAPNADEDREGIPFSGKAGVLLDRMLASIGLDRGGVYLANIVPWRPPGNRAPTPQEIASCLPFITRQIELAQPDFLLCLGGPPMQALCDQKDGVNKTRGQWFDYVVGERRIKALSTLNPAFLMKQPLQKRLVWRDMLLLKEALQKG